MAKRLDNDRTVQAGAEGKLHDQVAVRLGIDITSGAIPEGETLPTEWEGVKQFGVSRTTYREAIRFLASKGLVSSRAKVGTRVNPRSEWAILDPAVIRWMFSREPGEQSLQSLFELRMIVEPAAAEMAALRRSTDQLLTIGRALDQMKRHGYRSAEGQVADGEFHSAILEATNNDFLIGLTQSISTAVRMTTMLKASASKSPRDPIPLHFDVYSAIADKDPVEARSATLTLLEIAREDTHLVLSHKRPPD